MAFEFKERKKIHLEIAGNAFDLEHNGDLLKKVGDAGRKMVAYSADPTTTEDTAEDMAYFVYDRIDEILGDGAADKIFAGRAPEFMDAYDVFGYIIGEINSVGKNRQQRRASAKQQPPKQNKQGGHYRRKHKK